MLKKIVLVLAAVLLALGGLGAMAASASDQANTVATDLRLDRATRTSTPGLLVLSAVLTTTDGRPLSDQPVDFYLYSEVFGPRDVHIGAAKTDATGVALISYQPALRGRQTIKARFSGNENYAQAQTSSAIDVREVKPPFVPEPLPLASILPWLLPGIGVILVSVWGALLGVFLSAVLGINAASSVGQPRQNGRGWIFRRLPWGRRGREIPG
jgi:hypothetical protein